MLGSEDYEGVTISTAASSRPREPARGRAGPPAPQLQPVGGPGRRPVRPQLQPGPGEGPGQGVEVRLDRNHRGRPTRRFCSRPTAAALAGLIDQNRERLVMQNMLKEGNAREQAEGEIDLLKSLVEYFGKGTPRRGRHAGRLEDQPEFRPRPVIPTTEFPGAPRRAFRDSRGAAVPHVPSGKFRLSRLMRAPLHPARNDNEHHR